MQTFPIQRKTRKSGEEMEGAQPAPEREVPGQAARPGTDAAAEAAAAPPETEADDIYDLPAAPELPGTPDLPAAPEFPAEAPAEEARHELPEALRRELRGGLHQVSEGGFGLPNIQKRIQLAYGPEYGIELWSEPGCGTQVTLRIPAGPEKS